MKTKQQQQQQLESVSVSDDDTDSNSVVDDLCNNLNRIVRLNSSESTSSSTTTASSDSPVLCEQSDLKLMFSISGKSKKNSLISTATTKQQQLANFGDDVGFSYENQDYYFFGLADGVSGNSKKGFDAKLFPLALLSITQYLLETEFDIFKKSNTLLFDLLCKSHQIVQDKCVYGSSTVCMLALNKATFTLNTLNLGDSGYLLIRNNQVFYKSVAQSHRHNAPYQIGCTPPELFEFDLYRDMPEDSNCLQHSFKTGDFILLSSDGLFDNLYEDEIAMIIENHLQNETITQELLDSVCEKLVEKASKAEIKRDDILIILIHVQ